MESKRIVLSDIIVYKNVQGQYHRLDGPAVEHHSGTKAWYINGKYHREDGPAIEWYNGGKEYYLNDIPYSENQFHQEVIKLKLNRIKEL